MDFYKTIHDFLRTQPIFKAYVFGSYSRSEEKADSDIDILLELEKIMSIYISLFSLR